MELALDVVNRALQGDPGALSFLERTSSIYVLDATDASNPKTYGCWNFIHQAMNELERYEAKYLSREIVGGNLSYLARMLASLALRVAQRGPMADKALVTTCISNSLQYDVSAEQSKWLIDLNLELREIVMGRIAAMAFDFSFYERSCPNGRSAFADRVVMDTFCAILSANAVSCGPQAVENFATEWIIPSSKNLPTFSVASVVLHLALQGVRKSAPYGTKNVLQKLSFHIMSIVLVPTLAEALSMNGSETIGVSSSDENSQVASVSFRAIKAWCDATDLSLPQIKHICTKVNVNVVDILSDAMYSDAQNVIDSLAELVETVVVFSDEKVMSVGRMSQVRHIIQPNEVSFQSQFSPHKLKQIESHEMASIVDELQSAIALQRFRFDERQSKGDVNVCRNLVRIVAAVVDAWVDILAFGVQGQNNVPDSGAVSLLVKGASHPSVHVCAISLPVLARILPFVSSLPKELLPVLQRKAIIPHHIRDGHINMDISDICGVSYDDFQSFRTTVLSEVLVACWRESGDHYMDSCTSAVEEFCSVLSTSDVSLQLEAALFCIEQVSSSALNVQNVTTTFENQLKRIFSVVPTKPPSLMSNPVTRERMCRFIRKSTQWLATNGVLDVAMDLLLSSFYVAVTSDLENRLVDDVYRSFSHSSVHDVSRSLKDLLCLDPQRFATSTCFVALSGLWDAVIAASDRSDIVHVDDRLVLCGGISHVILALADDQRIATFEAIVSQSLSRLERWTQIGKSITTQTHLVPVLQQVGDEIHIFAVLLQNLLCTFAATSKDSDEAATPMKVDRSGEVALTFFRKVWPCVQFAAEHWVYNKSVARGISFFLSGLLPQLLDQPESMSILNDLCQLLSALLRSPSHSSNEYVEIAFSFMGNLFRLYGTTIEKNLAIGKDQYGRASETEFVSLIENLTLKVIEHVQESLGYAWTKRSEQDNGQVAFESKAVPSQKVILKSSEALGGVLDFLTKGLLYCPNFIIHLPSAGSGLNLDSSISSDDMLLRRAVDAAGSALEEHSNLDALRSAIQFLKALILQLPLHDSIGQSYVVEWISRLRPQAILVLVLGSCGKYSSAILGDVAELLFLLLQSASSSPDVDVESYILSPLNQSDQFLLGDRAREVTCKLLLRCARESSNTHTDLSAFLSDVWFLHQIEDPSVLPGSDVVDQFIVQYDLGSTVH